MRALITGVTGQDGAYLAQLLLSNDYDVVGVSPRRSDDGKNMWRLDSLGVTEHPRYTHETCDITCSASVTSLFTRYDFDYAYNLAAQSFVAESFRSPFATSQINYFGVLNILEAIRQISRETRFYQASTSEMFGLVYVDGQNEETPFHPRSPYGVAKAAAHYLVQNYREAYGLFACCGILFNHESPLRGLEFVTRKITDGVARIVSGKSQVLRLGNMDALRDWGYAPDYVRGMYMMLQHGEPDDYVLATGVTHSVRDVVDIAFGVVGLDPDEFIEQDLEYMRPSDVPLLCGDASKAKRVLGWTPTVDFESMIREMVHFDLQRHGYDILTELARG